MSIRSHAFACASRFSISDCLTGLKYPTCLCHYCFHGESEKKNNNSACFVTKITCEDGDDISSVPQMLAIIIPSSGEALKKLRI